MKGGWRWNAGRPARHRKTTSALWLDVRKLKREGALTPGSKATVRWSTGAAIEYTVGHDHIALDYRWTRGQSSEHVTSEIQLEQTACNLGGSRTWFLCPDCGARVAIIYVRRLRSYPECARLVYPIQFEDAIGRSWRRARQVELRSRAGTGACKHRWRKGMRRATFKHRCTSAPAGTGLARYGDGSIRCGTAPPGATFGLNS